MLAEEREFIRHMSYYTSLNACSCSEAESETVDVCSH